MENNIFDNGLKEKGMLTDAYLGMFAKNDKNKLDELIAAYSNKEEITKQDIIDLLNIAVCDELLASFNYLISYSKSKTNGKADFDPEFEDHEKEEWEHAHTIINRLRELSPEGNYLDINIVDYPTENSCGNAWNQETSVDSVEILKHRLEEERCAIKFYGMVIECILRSGDVLDSTTKSMIEDIKKDEEQHELDLRDLLAQYEE